MTKQTSERLARIREALSASDIAAARQLRKEILVGEQGLSPEVEADGMDDRATHVVACLGDEVIGTARLVTDSPGHGVIGRVVVASAHRGAGVAGELILALERIARRRKLKCLVVHAHDDLEAFYAGLGFRMQPDAEAMVGSHRVLRMEKGL